MFECEFIYILSYLTNHTERLEYKKGNFGECIFVTLLANSNIVEHKQSQHTAWNSNVLVKKAVN